jgi:isocitrate dehydrogenase
MLRHLGYLENAAIIENALLYTLEQGIHTGDFGDRSKPSLNTTEFAQAVIDNFGRVPEQGMRPILENVPESLAVCRLEKNTMMVSKEMSEEKIVGVDIFIESAENHDAVARKCLQHTTDLFKLVTISNRGTQVWPKGSVFTNLVNQYTCRFESTGATALTQIDVLELQKRLTLDFKICSIELLNEWDGKRSYSLAQGQ